MAISASQSFYYQFPSSRGPRSGPYWEEIDEWARQIRRWIIGSSESFHYFLTHFKGRPFFAGLWWFFSFFMYYAVIKFVFRGKKDAGHVMAAKAGFGAVTIAQEQLSQAQQPLSQEASAVIDLRMRLGPLERGATGSFRHTTAVQKSSNATHSWSGVVSHPLSPLSWSAPTRPRAYSDPVVEQRETRSEPVPALDLEGGLLFGTEILCALPPEFFFGAQAFDPRSVPVVHGPARIYGLDVAAR